MANSKLYGTYISVKPIKGEIDTLYQKYSDSPVLKHIISTDDGKPDYSLSYSYAKKLKHYFSDLKDKSDADIESNGGHVLKNFINKALENNRTQIHRHKKVKHDIGMENQFIKTHNKSFVKPTDHKNLKANKSMEKMELTEWVLKEQEAMFADFDTIREEGPYVEPKKACICILLNPEKKILLLKRSNIEGWMPEKYALVGGKQEEGETNYECVIREILEETELVVNSLVYCFNKSENSTNVDVFVGICLHPNEIVLSEEHTDYKWVKGNEIDSLDTVPNLKEDITKALEIFKDKTQK